MLNRSPVNYQDLDIEDPTGLTTQVVSRAHLKNQEENYFYKEPPADLIDPSLRRLRIMNEALCGNLVSIVCKRLGSHFLTPQYRLVLGDSLDIVGLINAEISGFSDIFSYGENEQTTLRLLADPGFSQICAIRFFLNDTDGGFNFGYDSKEKLVSIDYGLSNFTDLFQSRALTPAERSHLPKMSDTANSSDDDYEPDVRYLDMNAKNVICGFLADKPSADPVDFLTHHTLGRFRPFLKLFCQDDEKKKAVHHFFEQVYRTFEQICLLFEEANLLGDLKTSLSFSKIKREDQATFQEIFGYLETRAFALSQARYSLSRSTPVRFRAFLESLESDLELVEVMLTASPEYKKSKRNEDNLKNFSEKYPSSPEYKKSEKGGNDLRNYFESLNEERMLEEKNRLGSDRKITLANGGDNYLDILPPKSPKELKSPRDFKAVNGQGQMMWKNRPKTPVFPLREEASQSLLSYKK